MQTGIYPWVDCVFKRLFAVEENKDMLLSIINAALLEGHEPGVVDITILNPYNLKDFLDDKLSILDIKAKNANQEEFLIEIQVKMYESFPKRILYYWAKNYESQMQEGEFYDKLHRVTIIGFTLESLPILTNSYYNLYKILNTQKHSSVFCDDLRIATIELSKFQRKEESMSEMEKWTYFLKYGNTLEEDNLPPTIETPQIRKAVRELNKFSLDNEQRARYEARMKSMRDGQALLSSEFNKGKIEGIKEGIKEGEIKGKIEGLAMLLKIRFEERGVQCMPKIRSIQDLDKLNSLLSLAMNAQNIEEFEHSLSACL